MDFAVFIASKKQKLQVASIKGEDNDKPNRRDVYSSPEKRMGINDVAMLPLRLGTKEDKYRLGETECFVRHSLEVFTANAKDDVNRLVLDHTTMAVKIGQVRLRCLSCYSKCSTGTMPENSVYYPRNILSINKAVRDFKRSNLHMCPKRYKRHRTRWMLSFLLSRKTYWIWMLYIPKN